VPERKFSGIICTTTRPLVAPNAQPHANLSGTSRHGVDSDGREAEQRRPEHGEHPPGAAPIGFQCAVFVPRFSQPLRRLCRLAPVA